ncbi:hypothetical protein [Hafnia psychrotolerans]|uniref:hypothetical protein n=1 Tax=Hafnia psychrotolerans TaxID=1477018 RepID=UPI001666C2DC|nr:hypothetical protein [Hafnia psychrotolerans]
MKQRFFSFLGFLLFSGLSSSIFYAGLYLLSSYQKYNSVVVYSIWSIFAILFPLFFMPYALMLIPAFIQGRSISSKSGKILIRISLFFLAATLIGMISFSIIFKNTLKNRGYIECQGVPSGWTPGMATKYTLDISNCNK